MNWVPTEQVLIWSDMATCECVSTVLNSQIIFIKRNVIVEIWSDRSIYSGPRVAKYLRKHEILAQLAEFSGHLNGPFCLHRKSLYNYDLQASKLVGGINQPQIEVKRFNKNSAKAKNFLTEKVGKGFNKNSFVKRRIFDKTRVKVAADDQKWIFLLSHCLILKEPLMLISQSVMLLFFSPSHLKNPPHQNLKSDLQHRR